MTGIRVSGLSKRFGSVQVLSNISFEVAAGSFCTLLGPSGCGKTTLLRLIAGLERPGDGEVWYGTNLQSSKRHFTPPQARRVGYVFQSYALWPHMRVFDQVAYPLRVRRLSRDAIATKVARILDTVGLKHLSQSLPSELSGGQQQRVALARALVVDPAVLLLDEPLSNLDAALRHEMRVELQRLHHDLGVTTIYVTHDQLEAMALSDLVIVMHAGHIVEMGPPRSISELPHSAYTAKFVGSANVLDVLVESAGSFSMVEVRLEGGSILKGMAVGDFAPGAKALAAFKPEDITVHTAATTNGKGIRAVVDNTTYLGSHVMVQLRIGNSIVRAELPKQTVLAPGEEVFLLLANEAVRILPLIDLDDVSNPVHSHDMWGPEAL